MLISERPTGASQSIVDYDRLKVALGKNFFEQREVVNDTGDEITVLKGTVLGVINTGANAGKLKPFDSTSIDGSEIPRFVANANRTIADTASVTMNVINDGLVAERALTFVNDPTDGIDINIAGVGTPRDLLLANSAGIKATPVDDSTAFDN